MTEEQEKILNRLKRIEGQIRGLQRMIEKETPCEDILTQLSAATAAMKQTGIAIVQAYMKRCLAESGNKSFDNFEKALTTYIKLS